MALSQKHSGKVLVPWFNTAEWKYVYELIYSDDEQSQRTALDVLKTWKIRTPLLSAGIEGSLIVLDALLTNKEALSDSQLTQIYAVSLMRFLNICAANNERQGTFYRTALQHELPKWLINIRHDIAHGHVLPSTSLLEIGLNFCLNWLKTKYWIAQRAIIIDYVVGPYVANSELLSIIQVYTQILHNCYTNTQNTDELQTKLTLLLPKKKNIQTLNCFDARTPLQQLLNKSLARPENKVAAAVLSQEIASKGVLLLPQPDLNENHTIPKNFRDIWVDLLNTLHENGYLFSVLNALFDVTVSEIIEMNTRRLAGLWIKEIFLGLLKMRSIRNELDILMTKHSTEKLHSNTIAVTLKSILNRNSLFEESIDFNTECSIPLEEAKAFQERIMRQPNEHTLIYLEIMLKFNNCPANMMSDLFNVIQTFTSPSNSLQDDERFYSTQDLKDILSCNENGMDVDAEKIMTEPEIRKWNVVKDKIGFRGCPLGLLPNQSRDVNPFLVN